MILFHHKLLVNLKMLVLYLLACVNNMTAFSPLTLRFYHLYFFKF